MSRAEWTFMVYMAGDNNLSDAGVVDLEELRRVGSTERVNIVVEFDNAGDLGTRRFHVQENGAGERVEHLGETDCGDPRTLVDFLQWCAREYPARRYALVLWNHGGGWQPTDLDQIARSVDAPGYTPRELAERSSSPLGRVLFRTTHEKVFRLPGPSERAICSDDGTGHSLDMLELERVLRAGVQAFGQPLDLLGMDACLMSNVEVAYQVREHAQWIVASEENEPNNGWPYDRILRRLADDPDMATGDLAVAIVEDYAAAYAAIDFRGDVTQAAVATERIGALRDAMRALGRRLVEHMPAAAAEIWRAQRHSTHFWHGTLWDIREFCDQLAGSDAHGEIREAAAKVVAEVDRRPDGFIADERKSGPRVGGCGGVSVYLVSPLSSISPFYADLAWARDVSSWLEMLQAYHAV